jgi:hypothetical protein
LRPDQRLSGGEVEVTFFEMKDKLKNFKFLNEKRYKELQVIWKVGLQG